MGDFNAAVIYWLRFLGETSIFVGPEVNLLGSQIIKNAFCWGYNKIKRERERTIEKRKKERKKEERKKGRKKESKREIKKGRKKKIYEK